MNSQPSSDHPIRVMIVDDHEMFAQSLEVILAREPDIAVVATASTAAQASAEAGQHHPDVVLLDYQLDADSGCRVARLLRTECPDLKVIMLTASTDSAVLADAVDAGCAGYVTKDKTISEVVRSVRAVHAGEATMTGAMLARLLPMMRREHQSPGFDLTPRELTVLRLLATGISTSAIAGELHISVNTVRNHTQNLLSKLEAHSQLEAVTTAQRLGILREGA
jgi:DNA-binding NarL/FixJ family response regulator